MTSFTVKPSGSITVKPVMKGDIAYVFKGKPMHYLPGVVLSQTEKRLVVQGQNEEMLEFVRSGKQWFLESSLSIDSLLHGTEFIERNNTDD